MSRPSRFDFTLFACSETTITLIKVGGWKQREVAAECGLGSGAAISMGVKTVEKTVHRNKIKRMEIKDPKFTTTQVTCSC